MLLEQINTIKQNISIPTPSECLIVQVSNILDQFPSDLEVFLRLKRGELLVAFEDIDTYNLEPNGKAANFVKEQFQMLETILTWAMIDGYNFNMELTPQELEELRKSPLFANIPGRK